MKELFLPYELSILARDKGFDELCFAYYRDILLTDEKIFHLYSVPNRNSSLTSSIHNQVAAPLYQQIVDWFRERHDFHFYVDTTPIFDTIHPSKYKVHIKKPFQPFKWTTGHYYTGDTYYEALNKAIEETFKLI